MADQGRLFSLDDYPMTVEMGQSKIENLCTRVEGQYFDRKSARKDAREIARHIIAFANANGGTLVIGIEDKGEITGFRRSGAHAPEEFELVAINCCEPVPQVSCTRVAVKNSSHEDDIILVIDVKVSRKHVVRNRETREVHLRKGDKSVKLEHDQITALEYDRCERLYETEIVQNSSIADIDQEIVDQYREILDTDESAESVLSNRGFMEDGKLNVAGVLLFAKNPYKYLATARVRFIRFAGQEMGVGSGFNIVKEKTFEGPIPKLIGEVREMVISQLREYQYLDSDGKFIIMPEYPEDAWFEGLVNALTHRDYSISGNCIQVHMYDDRMEIISPGGLPNIVTLENMKNERFSRNPRIARTLCEFGWVKELNEGVKRIYDVMQRCFLNDPVYSEPEGRFVKLVLENSITSRALRDHDSLREKLSSDVVEGLDAFELLAVQYAYNHGGRITSAECMERINRSKPTALRVLKGLVDKGVLVWHGTSKRDSQQFYSFD